MEQLSIFKDEKEIISTIPKNRVYYDRSRNYFRCPFCDNMLTCSAQSWIKFCDECGKRLNWDVHEKNSKGETIFKKGVKR